MRSADGGCTAGAVCRTTPPAHAIDMRLPVLCSMMVDGFGSEYRPHISESVLIVRRPAAPPPFGRAWARVLHSRLVVLVTRGQMAAMRRTIQLAISRGVPTFNTGDHMGCAMIYRACAAELLGSGQGLSHEAVAVLRSAVQDSQRGDATSAAWALREALDWCLAHTATAQRTAPDEARVEAATIIHDAIAAGVPLFNRGDHAACADVYAEATRRLNSLARLQLPAATREQLTKAADASSSRPTDRAWALRRALDSCLEATAGAHGGGGFWSLPCPDHWQ